MTFQPAPSSSTFSLFGVAASSFHSQLLQALIRLWWPSYDLTQIVVKGSVVDWVGGGVVGIKIHGGALLLDVNDLLDFASVPLKLYAA